MARSFKGAEVEVDKLGTIRDYGSLWEPLGAAGYLQALAGERIRNV